MNTIEKTSRRLGYVKIIGTETDTGRRRVLEVWPLAAGCEQEALNHWRRRRGPWGNGPREFNTVVSALATIDDWLAWSHGAEVPTN